MEGGPWRGPEFDTRARVEPEHKFDNLTGGPEVGRNLTYYPADFDTSDDLFLENLTQRGPAASETLTSEGPGRDENLTHVSNYGLDLTI